MGLLKLLIQNPLAFILIAIPLLYSVILHELAHGWVAYRMGDPTAKLAGRLSLNPIKHLDPIGTAMLFLIGFGWARPVPVNFNQLRNRRGAMIAVAAAGVVANMLLAFGAMLLSRVLAPSPSGLLGGPLYWLAQINIILAAFNLIPLPPLDGSKILMGFVSPKIQNALLRIEPFGFFIIIGLLYAGVLDPVIEFFRQTILLVINWVL
jgi:Zn-dependent protease